MDFNLIYQQLQLQLCLLEGLDSSHDACNVGNCLDDLPCLTFTDRFDHFELAWTSFLGSGRPHDLKSVSKVAMLVLVLLLIFLKIFLSDDRLEIDLQLSMLLLQFLQLSHWSSGHDPGRGTTFVLSF